MSKTILATLIVTLVCAVGATAHADGNVPAGTLNAMGLSGLNVMSDSDGMAVRGKAAFAGGLSWAVIGPIFDPPTTGSINFYFANGKYEASGANGSAATATWTQIKQVQFSDGTSSTETRIRSLGLSAGGFSSAKSF